MEHEVGKRLCEDLIRLGVDAQIASEKEVTVHKEVGGGSYGQRPRLVADGRLYSCTIRVNGQTIDHISISKHYRSSAPSSYEIAYAVAGKPGDMERIKKLGRALKAKSSGLSFGHLSWKGGRLADQLSGDWELSQLPEGTLKSVTVEPYLGSSVRICTGVSLTFSLTEELFRAYSRIAEVARNLMDTIEVPPAHLRNWKRRSPHLRLLYVFLGIVIAFFLIIFLRDYLP